jgi:hypothetical protein
MNDIRSIKLIGIELCAFEIILKFIYTGDIQMETRKCFFLFWIMRCDSIIEFAKMWINLYETQFDSLISLILRKRHTVDPVYS